jgi:hypothetical protein
MPKHFYRTVNYEPPEAFPDIKNYLFTSVDTTKMGFARQRAETFLQEWIVNHADPEFLKEHPFISVTVRNCGQYKDWYEMLLVIPTYPDELLTLGKFQVWEVDGYLL